VREAYRRIGYSDNGALLIPLERRLQIRREVMKDLASRIAAVGGTISPVPRRRDVLLLNGQLIVSVRLVIPRMWRGKELIWTLFVRRRANLDLQIFVRLNPERSTGILDYLVIPRLADIAAMYHVTADGLPAFIDVYRANDLSGLATAMSCSPLLEIA